MILSSDENRVELTVEVEKDRRVLRILAAVLRSGPDVRGSLTNLLDSLFEEAAGYAREEEDRPCRSTTPTPS